MPQSEGTGFFGRFGEQRYIRLSAPCRCERPSAPPRPGFTMSGPGGCLLRSAQAVVPKPAGARGLPGRHGACVGVSPGGLTRRSLPLSRGQHVRAPPSARALQVTCSGLSISEKFAELRQKQEVALIPFIVAGDPDLETTERALRTLTECGADIIELGVPYSDPLADGPVIQAASARALLKGTDLQSVLDLLRRVSPSLSAPVVLFTYFNPIMKRGLTNFMRDAREAGAAGLVVPDVPLEETGPLREAASQHGLELVLLTTPTTPEPRMQAIAAATQGFLYLVSLTGVTGERKSVEGRVQNLLQDIRQASTVPVAVGFGISRPEHVEQVVSWGADGVIVGSALVRLLGESSGDGVESMAALMKSLKAPCMARANGTEISSVST